MKRLSFCLSLVILCGFMLCLFFGAAAEDADFALYPIRENSLWGYMNRQGETVIEPKWAYAWPFDGKTALISTCPPAVLSDTLPSGDGIIDRNGSYVLTPAENTHVEAYPFAYRIRYNSKTDPEGYDGFYDKSSGFYQSPLPEYKWVMLWNEDGTGPIAVENQDGLIGYVSRTNGETVIPFQYTGDSGEECFHGGYARPADQIIITDANGIVMMLGMEKHLIDAQGNDLSFASGIEPASAVYDGYFIFSMEVSVSEDDMDREEDVEDETESMAEYGEESDDSWYSADGTRIVLPLYRVDPLTGNRELLEEDHFLYHEDEENDLTLGYGLSRMDGTVLYGPDSSLRKIWPPDENGMLCLVSDDDLLGHMDLSGNVIVAPKYRIDAGGAEPGYHFRNGYAVICDIRDHRPEAERWIILDKDGNEVFSCPVDTEEKKHFRLCGDVLENGLIWYEDEDGYGLIKLTDHGAEVISGTVFELPFGYGVYQSPDEKDAFSEGLHPVKQNGLWGYIDETAQWVIPPQYDSADSFKNDLALVEKDGKLRYINHDGTVIWKEE